MSFAQVLTEGSQSGFTVPETWHQGRTAYGGFSSALALHAARAAGGDLPPLRSAQIAMIAPLAGAVSASGKVVRRGRNATWVAAEIEGDKGLGLTASFVFMGTVSSSVLVEDCPAPEGLIGVEDARPFVNDRAPAFLRHHFDVRFALPRSEAKAPEVCWWVRPRDHALLDPTLALVLSADALPPGVMPLLGPAVPVSTMHWQINLLTAMPRTRDGWWLLQSRADYARDGGSSQRMAVWNSDGVPMLSGTQSIALFG